MERTLEDWFAELDRLLVLRDGHEPNWLVQRTSAYGPDEVFSVSTSGSRNIGAGRTLKDAVRNACTYLVASARRVVEAQ